MKRKNIIVMTSAALAAALTLSMTGIAFANDTEESSTAILTASSEQQITQNMGEAPNGAPDFGGQMPGQMGQMPGQMGQMPGQTNNGTQTEGTAPSGGPSFDGQMPDMSGQTGQMPGQMGGMGMMGGTASYASAPSEIINSTLTENTAEDLTADEENAATIVMSDENSSIKISESGTYIITGTCSDGNIAVKKGTTDVVLILKDLDLTSTVGATLSLNKGSEVKVVIEGTVTLTDAEDLADEDTDDFDGAAIKAKAGSAVVLTGDGTLIINGSCKNGIKVSDLEEDDIADGYTEASFIIDGEDLTIKITAANDGINSGTDLTIRSGNITVSAGDDAIKADYILTIGEDGTAGPTIKVDSSTEALEGAIVNIYSGTIDLNASDDGINAANSDLTDYSFSINIMGGTTNVSAGSDGLDSNGNINITAGLTTIVRSASGGGDAGLDYQGSCYVADGCLVNPYGVSMDSGMGGMMGGQMPGMNGSSAPAEDGTVQPNGSAPSGALSFGGQGPDMTSQESQSSTPQDSDTQQNGNWFTNLFNTIKGWFTK